MEIPYLLSVLEGIAGHGNKDGLLRVQDSAGRVHSETLHVGRLEGPSDTASGRVDHLKRASFWRSLLSTEDYGRLTKIL